MIISHLVLGSVGLLYGLGMVYFAKREKVPLLVRPLLFAGWIKSDEWNRRIARVFGYATIFSSSVILVCGILGKPIWPIS